MPAVRSAAAVLLSSHPAPTVAVTAMATVLAIAAGNPPPVVALVLAAVLSGQLSIGWSNDLVDAERDRAADRQDKPFARGAVGRRVLVVALAVAAVAVVPLSLALGLLAGAAHLLGVVCGWLYNLGLKSTVLSPVPYLVAFGALPSVATLARSGAVLPPWWATLAGALLGIAAHFGNVLPDIEEDRRAGVRGAPQRIGPSGTAVAAAAALVAAAAALLLPGGPPSVATGLLGALVAALAVSVVAIARAGRRLRLAFGAVMLAAALCVAMLVVQGALAA